MVGNEVCEIFIGQIEDTVELDSHDVSWRKMKNREMGKRM